MQNDTFLEQLKKQMKNYPVTMTLIFVNVAMLIVTLVMGGFTQDNLVQLGGLVPDYVKSNYEFYRIITAMFLHGNLFHIFSNMFVLYMLGTALEKAMGPYRFTALYFISGIGSGIAVVLFSNPLALTIGASGAIWGIIGALLYITFARPTWFTPRAVRSIRTMMVLNLILTFAISNISISGHLGGLLFGLLASLVLIPKHPHFMRFVREFHNGRETVGDGDPRIIS